MLVRGPVLAGLDHSPSREHAFNEGSVRRLLGLIRAGYSINKRIIENTPPDQELLGEDAQWQWASYPFAEVC